MFSVAKHKEWLPFVSMTEISTVTYMCVHACVHMCVYVCACATEKGCLNIVISWFSGSDQKHEGNMCHIVCPRLDHTINNYYVLKTCVCVCVCARVCVRVCVCALCVRLVLRSCGGYRVRR